MKKPQTTKKTQAPINQEDMGAYLTFLLSGQAKDEDHAKQINRVSRHITTAADVTIIARLLDMQLNQKITEVMDVIQIQNRVLQKLGATKEMFDESEQEYTEELNAFKRELEERAKQANEAPAQPEEATKEELEDLKETLEEHDA